MRFLLTLALLPLIAAAATAQSVWNSSLLDWNTASSWTPSGVPTTGLALFNGSAATSDSVVLNPTITAPATALSLTLGLNQLSTGWAFTGTSTLTLGGTGSTGLTTLGTGTYVFNGPTLAGAGAAALLNLNVQTGSTLVLRGDSAITANQGALNIAGGTLQLDNTTTNVAARLSATGAITVNGGGTLWLVGNAAGTATNLGNLTTTDNGLGGINTVRVTPNGAATVLNFAATSTGSLRGGTRSIWNFVADSGNLGDAAGGRITFTAVPFVSSTNGLFANTATGATVGFATVTDALGKNFATYNTVGSTAIGVVSIANPGQSVATVSTVTDAAGLQGLAATAKGQFNAPAGVTTLTANAPGLTLRITPAAGASLAIATFNIAAAGIMLDGTNDFAITGTTGIVGSEGSHYFYVNDPATTLSIGTPITSGTNATIFAGPGFTSLTGTGLQNNGTSGNNYRLSLVGGTLRASNAQFEFGTVAAATRGVINFYGGVLEITAGTNGSGASADFRRPLGTLAGSVNWGAGNADTGSGGFSAFGAAASVNLGGAATPAAVVWNQANFVGDAYALIFGSTKSNAALNFLNPLGLDAGTTGLPYTLREIRVIGGVGGDSTTLAGVISGSSSSDLLKTGTGRLILSAANTFTGNVNVQGGTLQLGSATAPTASLAAKTITVDATLDIASLSPVFSVASGQTLRGKGTVTGEFSVASGGTVSPTAATGGLTVNGAVTFQSGSNFRINIAAPGTAGVAANSGGSSTGSNNGRLTLGSNMLTLDPLQNIVVDGGLQTFTDGSSYSYIVGTAATVSGITAGTPPNGIVDPARFSFFNFPGISIITSPSLTTNGTLVYLNFTAGTAVPEPALLGLAGLAVIGLLRRRK